MNGLWYDEIYHDRVRFGLRVERTLFAKQSDFQRVDVFQTVEFGRALAIDGVYMTSEKDEFYYHEMLVHPALTTASDPRRVLVIGGGDGGTVREVLRHPAVERVTMVEIDGVVVDACKQYLPAHGNWDDPRLELIIGDGIDYVARAEAGSFDVILLDGTDPVGPAKGLFNVEFYRNVHRVMARDGVFALQSESPVLMRDIFLEIVKTLGGVFGSARPYFGPVPLYVSGLWSWTFASNSIDPLAPRDDRLTAIEAGCKYYNRDIHRAAFALPNHLRAELPAP